MTEKLQAKAWDLFNAYFALGDDVVLIDEDDACYFGKLDAVDEEGCWLTRPQGTRRRVNWINVRFMAHDGFPVKKLVGADGSRFIEQIDTTDTVEAIRSVLSYALCVDCSKLVAHETAHRAFLGTCFRCDECEKKAHVYFGDPFEVEPVRSVLFNAGNSGPDWWDEPYEECLVMRAPDGAMAELFQIETVYHFEYQT